MPKPFREWTVLPHTSLSRVEDNLVYVTGNLHMPVGEITRRMTIAKLRDGGLVVYSAIALDEAEMRSLEAYGSPAYLVVPNALHRMDAKIWKDRYPSMVVLAPEAAREKVEEIVHVDATCVDFGDPCVACVTVPGTGQSELALLVASGPNTTLVVNDLIFNLAHREGLAGWLWKALGITSDAPCIPSVIKMREVKDEHALRDQLEQWAELQSLSRIIVSHGHVIANDAQGVLRRIASHLAA